jgi:hypothetical protein
MSYKNEGCEQYTSSQIESWIEDVERTLQVSKENHTPPQQIQKIILHLKELHDDLILKKQEENKAEMKQLLTRLLQIVESM